MLFGEGDKISHSYRQIAGFCRQIAGFWVRVRDTRTGYLIPVRDALWGPARMHVLFPRRRRRRRHSEN